MGQLRASLKVLSDTCIRISSIPPDPSSHVVQRVPCVSVGISTHEGPWYALVAVPPAPVRLMSHKIYLHAVQASLKALCTSAVGRKTCRPVAVWRVSQQTVANSSQWVSWTIQKQLFICSYLPVSH